jgi:hypothetical protein
MDGADTVREMVMGSFELVTTQTAQRTNDIMKRLTLISAVLLPAVVLAGVFGMNFHPPSSIVRVLLRSDRTDGATGCWHPGVRALAPLAVGKVDREQPTWRGRGFPTACADAVAVPGGGRSLSAGSGEGGRPARLNVRRR